MTIRLLSEQLAAKIAAGEVVERPVSVAKELIENSLDAGATRILVEIRGGGIELVRIVDNGSGMNSGRSAWPSNAMPPANSATLLICRVYPLWGSGRSFAQHHRRFRSSLGHQTGGQRQRLGDRVAVGTAATPGASRLSTGDRHYCFAPL